MAATNRRLPDQNLDLLVEQLRQGKAIFSTNLGKYPPRRAQPLSTPVILRSDCEADLASIIADLRIKFPLECQKITIPVNNIYEYFDHYDVNLQGSAFIAELLRRIAEQNEGTTKSAQQFATQWMKDHSEGFPDIDLEDEDLFSAEEKEKYSFDFLKDVLELLKGLQARPVASFERTIGAVDRGRPLKLSVRQESDSSIRQDSPASGSFETNPSNYRRAASASRERSTFLTPPMAFGVPLMTDRTYARRRNSARHTSAEQQSFYIPPVQYHSDTDAEAGVGLRDRLPLPSEPQLRNLHMQHSVRSVSGNMAGVADTRKFFANRSNYAAGVLEPFPPYFQSNNSGNINDGFSRTPNRSSRGQPFSQQGPPRRSQYSNASPGWSYLAANHYTASPTVRMLSNSNTSSGGQHHRNLSATQRSHSVYSSDPAFPISSNSSSVRPSPVLGGQALPYIPITIPQADSEYIADVQPYIYHGYIENMPPSSGHVFGESAPWPSPIPGVRNNYQSQEYQASQNVANQFSQHQQYSARHGHRPSDSELKGRAENQASSHNNPRKSISDDARTMPLGDLNSRRSSLSEHHTSRRGSSSELHGFIRDQSNVQQHSRRMSGARNGSRHSSFSQTQQPFRDQYKRSVQGAPGGYSPMGYFSASRGSGDYSHLIHQTIEEHRSDGDRNSLVNYSEVPSNENGLGQVSRFRGKITEMPNASQDQEQGSRAVEQVRHREANTTHERSNHLSTMQSHQISQPRNNTSDTQPLTSNLSTSTPQDSQMRYSRYYRIDRPLDPLKLYISAPTESVDEIHEVFRPYGNIIDIGGPFTRPGKKPFPNGGPPSFYFLTYSQPAEANTALERLNRTALPSGAGCLRVSFAFQRPWDIREVPKVTSSAESATRIAYPRNMQFLDATKSQAMPRSQLRDENPQDANQGPPNHLSAHHHVQVDPASSIIKQNVKKSSYVPGPSTPTKKRINKKSKNSTPTRKEGVSGADAQPNLAKPVSQIPQTAGTRSDVQESNKDVVKIQAHATRFGQIIANTQSVVQSSSKKNHEISQGATLAITPEVLPTQAEDMNKSVDYKQTFARRNDSHTDHEQLYILDRSPSRKTRNTSSSRTTSQPRSQPSPTETYEQVITGGPAVPDFSEDQWPALQRRLPSPMDGQHAPVIVTKRLNYRAISLKPASEAKTEGIGISRTAITKQVVHDSEEGFSKAVSKLTASMVTRANGSNSSGDLNEILQNTSANHTSEDVNSPKATHPADIHIRVPITSISIDAGREVASASGYNTANHPSHSQPERSNSPAEESRQFDNSSLSNSNDRRTSTPEPVPDMVRNKSETSSTLMSEIHETKNNLSLGQVPEHVGGALSSDVGIALETAPSFEEIAHETATTPLPAVDVQPPPNEFHYGDHEKTENTSDITASVTSPVTNHDSDTKLSSRAKGKQKVLTIEVPPRGLQSTATHSAPPHPSKSPKSSKSKQNLEVLEPSTNSSVLVPSPAISTHMKKKTKKITPPRKASKANVGTKKDTKTCKPLSTRTELDAFDGTPKDVPSPDPILGQESLADTHGSNKSNYEVAEATRATTVDLTVEGVSDKTQQGELSIEDPTRSDDQASRVRNYPAPDPSNAVYVTESRGPSLAKRKSLDLARPDTDSQLVQERSYPAPNPASAVYVTGRFPARMIVLDHSDQVEDEKVATTPPLSPDMPSKKDRAKSKKIKKRKSKLTTENQNISEPQPIMPFPKPKPQSAAFPTLPLDNVSPTNPPSQRSSELDTEASDPFGVWDPILNVEHAGQGEALNTEIWTGAANEKRSGTTAVMIMKNKARSFDFEAFDKGAHEFQNKRSPLDSELLQHIDKLNANSLGLTMDTTSTVQNSASMDSGKQDMTGNMLSSRSSINDNGSVPELTRGSSIVSSSSNIIFPDVPGYIPKPLSTLLAPVNLTHNPSFNSSSLQTSNLKAGEPQHKPEFDSNIFDRPAVRTESPPKSPHAPEFGSGSISAEFKPDVEQEEVSLEAFTPILSPLKPVFSPNLLDMSSNILETPLTKTMLSEEVETNSTASGFEHKSSTKAEASVSHLEKISVSDVVMGVQSQPEINSQALDNMKSITEQSLFHKMKTPELVTTSGLLSAEEEVKPLGIGDIHNSVPDIEDSLSTQADTKFERLEDSKFVEVATNSKKIISSEEVEFLEKVKPEQRAELGVEAPSQIVGLSTIVVDSNDTTPTECGSLAEPLKTLGQPSTSADIEDSSSAVQQSPTKTLDDAEPFSAVSEASTVKTAFPPLPSASFSTISSSPPKLSEANIAAHTVATDSDEAREQRRSRKESISEWSTTSSFRRKTYSEAANIPSPTRRTRGQSVMSPTDSEAEVDVKSKIKSRMGEANLWSIPRKEQRWTSAEE
ncbi:hypothetical protein MMC26_004612 [Xylographa opegraphella]|nr:hypothetical protein [Xylographa opegraphella]